MYLWIEAWGLYVVMILVSTFLNSNTYKSTEAVELMNSKIAKTMMHEVFLDINWS